MKKVLKASLAAGAAGALLLGGAGTFALWQGTGTIGAGTVTTGHLTLSTAAPGTWTDISPDVLPANATFDPATAHIVPGDTVKFSQTVTISADGKNLKGALTVGTLGAIPVALQDDVTVTLAATATGPNVSVAGDVVSFTAPGSYAVPVTITVAFKKGTAAGDTFPATMDKAIDLNTLALTLNQERP